MNHNNRKWYTVITISDNFDYEVFAHVRGEGNCYLFVSLLHQKYGDKIRILEGKHTEITDSLKAKFFYCM